MPGGSVTAKVSSVKFTTDRFITSGNGHNHLNVLELLKKFAVGDFKTPVYFGLELDNGVDIVINYELVVTIKTPEQKKSGKITRIVAWRMKDEAIPSRCDIVSNEVWASTDYGRKSTSGVPVTFSTAPIRCSRFEVLVAFATAPIRCLLYLELDNGLEIGIYLSLKPDVPAMDEPGSRGFDYKSRPNWDVKVSIWPMLESWLGLEPAPAEPAK